MATVLFGIARSLLVFYVLVHSSQTLHNKMFESILRAPVLFFDRNPIGKSDTQVPQSVCLVDTFSVWPHFSIWKRRRGLEEMALCVDSFSTKSSTDSLLPAGQNLTLGGLEASVPVFVKNK